jgi:hypothetical protein
VNHRGHGACAFLLTAKSKTPQLTCKPNITGSRVAFPMLASGDTGIREGIAFAAMF